MSIRIRLRICILKWASIVSLTFSIIALCTTCYREGPKLDFDYMGVIVAVFSLLVTLLIGYQIYNTIEINTKISKFENKTKRITEKTKTEVKYYCKSYLAFIKAEEQHKNGEYESSLYSATYSLIDGWKSIDKEPYGAAKDLLMCIVENDEGKGIKIIDIRKKEFLDELEKIYKKKNDSDLKKIISYFNKMETLQT